MPKLQQDVPVTSATEVGQYAIKMGWMEKEAEESMFGNSFAKKFAILTGWDQGEAHMFYYSKETDKEAGGVLFVHDLEMEDPPKGDPRYITLQGSQRRFRFRCENETEARCWRFALIEAKSNGGHKCKTGEACIAWMQEKHAKTCEKCHKLFSTANRKHHCRCCGRIFCQECSNAPKLMLEPYMQPVRCCNKCNDTQVKLAKQAKIRADRAQTFVKKYLSILEQGADFCSLIRSDLLRNIQLDNDVNLSLQYRSIIVTESLNPDVTLAKQLEAGGKTTASRLKAATMRVGESLTNFKPSHIVDAFKPDTAAKNIRNLKVATFSSVAGVGSHMSILADKIKDQVEGPRQHIIEIKHIQGVVDYAGNPTAAERYGEVAQRTFAIQIHDAPMPLELVAESDVQKKEWMEALTEVKFLAEDCGTDVLIFQKAAEEKDKKLQARLETRRANRLEIAQSVTSAKVKASNEPPTPTNASAETKPATVEKVKTESRIGKVLTQTRLGKTPTFNKAQPPPSTSDDDDDLR